MKIYKGLMITIIVLSLTSNLLFAQTWETTNKKETHYFQIAVGYGISYGGLGANIMYRANNIVFHAGVGVGLYPLNYFIEDIELEGTLVLYGGGIKIYFAKSNDNFFTNWYVDAQYGFNGITDTYDISYFDEDELVKLNGPSLLLGYDFNFGGKGGRIGGNLGLGGSYAFNSFYNITRFQLAIDWGITIRIN